MGHATMSAERGNDQLITVHAPFLLFAIARNQKSLSNMAINCVGRKFENNLQTAIKESFGFFFSCGLIESGAETYYRENRSEERCFGAIAKRMKSKNRMQITQFPERLSQHKHVLGRIQGM